MSKQNIFIGVVVGVVLMGIVLYFLLPDDTALAQLPTGIVFYFGDTCPHCKNVEEYIIQNNVQDKILFEQKEVYNDAQNAKELKVVAKACGIDPMKVGVPLLWNEGSCLVGDEDIITSFEEKINVQN